MGVAPRSTEEADMLSALAGAAIHATERTAAALGRWPADGPGVAAGEAQRAADRLATSRREDREGDGVGGTGHPG